MRLPAFDVVFIDEAQDLSSDAMGYGQNSIWNKTGRCLSLRVMMTRLFLDGLVLM